MANFFTLNNGNITDMSVVCRTIPEGSKTNLTMGYAVPSVQNLSYSPVFTSNTINNTGLISALAFQLSSKSLTSNGTINLNVFSKPSSELKTLYYTDLSNNNYSIIASNDPEKTTFSPYLPSGYWSVKFNSGIVAENNHYVSFPNIKFSNQPFTIECWVYPIGTIAAGTNLFGQSNGTAANSPKLMCFTQNINNALTLSAMENNTIRTSISTVGISANDLLLAYQWNHLAIVREGIGLDQTKIYVNGNIAASGTFSGNLSGLSAIHNIGYIGEGTGTKFNGYVSNYRVVTGAAVYTNNFTPSLIPLTNVNGTALLTLQNGHYTDNSNNTLTASINGSPQLTNKSPFGSYSYNPSIHGGSVYFRSTTTTSQKLAISPKTNFNILTNPASVEAWLYFIPNNGTEIIINGQNSGANTTIKLSRTTTSAIAARFSTDTNIITGPVVPSYAWIHVVATITSTGLCRLFINGYLRGTLQIAGYSGIPSRNFDYVIGQKGDNTLSLMHGYISDFRFNVGSIPLDYDVAGTTVGAKYFNPPTSPLTVLPNTQILIRPNTELIADPSYLINNANQTYAISSFSYYNNPDSIVTKYPLNWQILKLPNTINSSLCSNIGFTLSTSSPNDLSLLASPTAVDITGNSKVYCNLITLTSSSPFLNPNGESSFVINQLSNLIKIKSNPLLDFKNNDFTIEFFIFFTSATTNQGFFSKRPNDTSSNSPILLYQWSGNFRFYLPNSIGTAWDFSPITTNNPILANRWNHIAVVRKDSLFNVYFNGNSVINLTVNNTFLYHDNIDWVIGSDANIAPNTKYVSNLRFSNSALYTSNFAVPSAEPLKVLPSTVFLLKPGYAYNQEYITSNTPITGSIVWWNTSNTSGTELPYSNSGYEFDGVNYLRIINQNAYSPAFPTQIIPDYDDFTFEALLYITSNTTGDLLFANDSSIYISIAANNLSYLVTYSDNTTDGENNVTTIPLNTWCHISLCRNYEGILFFVNGVLLSKKTTNASKMVKQTTDTFNIGRNFSSGARISNISISRNCKYSGNFRPNLNPSTPITPNVNQIVLITSPYSSTFITNLSSRYITSKDDIHVGGSLVGLNEESRSITADGLNINNLYINSKGTYNYISDQSKHLKLNGLSGLQITPHGTFNMGTKNNPLSSSTNNIIILSGNSIDVHEGSTLNIFGGYKLPYGRIETSGGVVVLPTGNTPVQANFSLSASNWFSKDLLLFAPNVSSRTSMQTATCSSIITDKAFSINRTLNFNYVSAIPESIPIVYNLSRSTVIQGNSASKGFIRTTENSNVDINNTLLSDLGTNNRGFDKICSLFLGNTSVNLSGNVFTNNTTSTAVNPVYPYYSSSFYSTNFNGSTYFTTPSSTSLNLDRNGKFTIELYYFPNSFTTEARLFSKRNGTANGISYCGYINTNGFIAWYDNTNITSNTNQLKLSAWNHCAWVYDGGIISMYVNGLSTFGASTNSTFNNTFPLYLGSEGGTHFNNGFVSNFRIVSGSALYTSNFSPPRSNLSAIPGTTILTFQDKTIKDNSIYNRTFSLVAGVSSTIKTSPFRLFKNATIKNNIFYNWPSALNFSYLNLENCDISNNAILSGGLNHNLAGSVLLENISANNVYFNKNIVVGSNANGLIINNYTGSQVGGTVNYNNNLRGTSISGVNQNLIISNIENYYNKTEGVYVHTTDSNLSSVYFNNIISNYNNYGVRFIGNTLDYKKPIYLNINNMTASYNTITGSFYGGFEAYNIAGTISKLVTIGNKTTTNIRTSIGNGYTIIDGITSINTSTFDDSNKFKIFTAGDPLPPISSASPFGDGIDGSIKFGTGGIVTSKNLPAMAGDFTIEFFFYPNNATLYKTIIDARATSAGVPYIIAVNTEAKYNSCIAFYDAWGFYCQALFNLNQWNHYAVSRISNQLTIYLNGKKIQTFTKTGSYPALDSTFVLGENKYTGGFDFTGLISNLRIVNGIGLYSGDTITVPTKPLEIIGSGRSGEIDTVLLLKAPYDNFYYSSSESRNDALTILSAKNYNQTIIKNAFLSANPNLGGVGLRVDNAKLEDFRLENSLLYGSTPLLLQNTYKTLEGSYNIHNSNSQTYDLSSIALNGYQSDIFTETGIAVMKENGINGANYRFNAAGKLSYDNSIVKTGGNIASEKLQPMSSTIKLRSGSKLIPINAGETIDVSVYVLKSVGYSGDLPRLILKGNESLGYSDTVLSISSPSIINPNWELLSGNIPASIGTGIIEIYVDCSGPIGSGSINIDEWDFS